MTDALFDAAPYRAEPTPPREPDEPALSADRRYTARQLVAERSAIRALMLHRGPQHPDGAPVYDLNAPGLRCQTCQMLVREPVGSLCARTATYVRAVWPACVNYQPREDA
jgi:hypothetical protein